MIAVSEVDVALEVLAQLSERSTNGRLRDAIAIVRDELWYETEVRGAKYVARHPGDSTLTCVRISDHYGKHADRTGLRWVA